VHKHFCAHFWEQQGLEQGLQKGRLEGETSLLERQFIKRFGALTEETRARLRASSSEQRQLWAERIFDALNLEDVFIDD
jgi:flagellar biosynthesis/type III secretory pathway protein FliH